MKINELNIGNQQPFFVIAGPCVIENERLVLQTAQTLKEIAESLGIGLVFKSSFDKANRSSLDSFRGPGIEQGLRILEKVKTDTGLPVLTDVHEDTPLDEVASVVDVIQTPAFLARQTNFILNVAKQGIPVNIKKGQFMAPWDMQNVVDKARSTGNEQIMVCDRGTSFGYNTLISDMRGLAVMRRTGCPVILMPPIRYNNPVGSAALPVATAPWCLYWRVRRLPPVLQVCLWKSIPTRIMP